MRRAIASGLAVTALGAGAVITGAATQSAVPASPVVLAVPETGDESTEAEAILFHSLDPDWWDSRYSDGSGD